MEAPLTLFVWSRQRVVPVRITDFGITEEAFDPIAQPDPRQGEPRLARADRRRPRLRITKAAASTCATSSRRSAGRRVSSGAALPRSASRGIPAACDPVLPGRDQPLTTPFAGTPSRVDDAATAGDRRLPAAPLRPAAASRCHAWSQYYTVAKATASTTCAAALPRRPGAVLAHLRRQRVPSTATS